MFIKFNNKQSCHVTYGYKARGKIPGECVVENTFIITIQGVLLVKGIKYTLLNIIQSRDKGYSIVFYTLSC